MKISKIIIPGCYPPFEDFELDLAYPEGHKKAGKPLDKICLIGPSGVGKTRLLDLMATHFHRPSSYADEQPSGIFKIRINAENELYYVMIRRLFEEDSTNSDNTKYQSNEFYALDIDEQKPDWVQCLFGEKSYTEFKKTREIFKDKFYKGRAIYKQMELDPLAYLTADEAHDFGKLDAQGMPQTNLNEALALFDDRERFRIINKGTANLFWREMIFHLKKREDDFRKFQEATPDKTYRQHKEEFEKAHPNPLIELAEIWNQFLKVSNLYFDVENAKAPTQLTENLEAHVRSGLDHSVVGYNSLSSGTKNFLFQIGHLFALYFNRKIERGLLLVDEPEKSLFPDFQSDLIYDVYEQIIDVNSTQFFVATHSPIIASQFDPAERVILDFDEQGKVYARKGIVPEGDDPNDILYKDFGMESLYGKKGREAWQEYIRLKKQARKEEDTIKKEQLIADYLAIGHNYNFPGKDEVLR